MTFEAAHLDLLTGFAGAVLFEIDADGRYLAISTGAPALLTRPADELLGRTLPDLLGPETGQAFIELFRRVLARGVPETFDYAADVVMGGRRSFRCQVLPTSLVQKDSERTTVTVVTRDITEEMELKARLVEAERRAAVGIVAASLGHEIRQPLAFATTSLEVVTSELGAAASDRVREALAHVRDGLQRIGSISASVVVVTPDAARRETTDVRGPTLAAVDLCASQTRDRARVVVVVGDLPHVTVDEGQLCQVLTNLLLNAAWAIEPRRVPSNRIEIRAWLAAGGTHVRISVADDGAGIEPANLARVFDPFFTTKKPGHGAGLGLHVCRRIVEGAGGALTLESTPGSGTIAYVDLPVAGPATDRVDAVSLDAAAPPSTPRSLVLVVDDEPAFLRSLELVLDATHDVVVQSRSPEALELVREEPNRFAAILCDVSMPQIDGVAFFKHVEALGLANRFIIMTAGAFTPRAEDFLRTSKCRRLTKPFTLEVLLAELNAVTGAATSVSPA